MSKLVDKAMDKLHIGKKNGSSSSSSSDDDVEKVMAILSTDFGSNFRCSAGKECTYGDPSKHPAGAKKMEYKSRHWHEKCFACAVCKKSFDGKAFVPKGDNFYCTNCYDEKFVPKCFKCKKMIKSGGVNYEGNPYHKECFTCNSCKKELSGHPFTSKDDKPYCGDCYGEKFAKRCSDCTKPIVGLGGGGVKFVTYEDRQWHNECFKCNKCKENLIGKGFIPDANNVLCSKCANAKK